MSNPTTNYKISTGQDLGAIFQHLTSATKAPITGYTVTGYGDLNQIFAPYIPGATTASTTGFKVNGTDLNSIFSPLQNTFTTTNQLISTSYQNNIYGTLATNFKLQSPYTKFNFVLYGGGGDGYQPNSTDGTGGAGSGAFIQATNIPYYYPGSTTEYMTAISYGISGGGAIGSPFSTTVTITYTNNVTLSLSAGSGQSKTAVSGGTGAAGGVTSTSIPSAFVSIITVIGMNGSAGGNTNTNGTSLGYTSSGSGSSSSSPYNPVGAPPTETKTFATYTITSRGGGKNQTVSGYGAGGAATPANYNSNAGAYRNGTPGCFIYYLS